MGSSGSGGNWFVNRSLRFKALLVLGMVMGLFVITASLFLRNQEEVRDARDWSQHTYEVLTGADDLLLQALHQENGLRGYTLTHNLEFLQPYQQGSEDFDKRISVMRALITDNPEQLGRIERINDIMNRWRTEFAAEALALAREGKLEATAQLMGTGRGKQLTDALKLEVRQLIAVEQSLLAQRDARLSAGLERIRILAYGALLGGLLFSLLCMVAIQRTMATPMNRLTELIARLTGGDLEVDVPHQQRGDEVGAIARALESFRQSALAIRRREWIKTHLSASSELLSRQHGYEDFGNQLLQYLCPLLSAGHGALFRVRAEDGVLIQIGGYGYSERRGTPRPVSEGLVAQCRRSGQPLALSPVPADYIRIGSGLGESAPHGVYLFPLPGIEGVAGVIELASFRAQSEVERELLLEVARLAGLALESLGNALRTRELLEETQAQSEELQASEEALRVQQEELRTANESLGAKNDALEEQGKRLRASEEELRVQAEELRTTNEALGDKSRAVNEFNERLLAFQQELEHKNTDLEQASRYKSEFLANMSHELRTPLNSLLILAKDLADNAPGNLNEDQVESARIVHESGHSLLSLINDILDLSKIEAGRMEVNWEPVEIDALTGTIERNFRAVARERGLALLIERAPQAPVQIRSDATKLLQILTNLVGNALKFTHQGQVKLLLARPSGSLPPLPGQTPDTTLAITVSDSGIGISPDQLARLFQAFEQGDGTTSRRYGGTGLGLSISRGLARMLGGDIVVHSESGKGSSFTLLLPENGAAVQPEVKAIVTQPLPAASQAPAPTIEPLLPPRPAPKALPDDRDLIQDGDTIMLVIEDDLAFSRILADMARRKGYRVLLATEGEAGLRLAAHYRPTGILLDIGLPGMDGWAVMQRLKSDLSTRHIPVHFITAADESARGLAMGAVGFITKPATRESLETVFSRLLHFSDGKKRRVMILDDEPGARLAVQKLLAEAQVDIVEAASVEDGLALLAVEAIDCIVLDLALPDGSGFEFLERAAQRGPVPPVVIYSARELTREEDLRLREYTDSIVIKGVQSPGRLLDEVSLFLHAVRKPSTPATTTAQRPSDLAGRAVLVVDDDMRNVFALSKALRGQGLNVVVAQDGRKALSQLELHPQVDWVLMDIMMPDMDGYEATREIRKRPEWRELPVIAVTAKAMKGDREKCLEAGASDYLTKPIDIDKLLSMMRAWTSRR